MKKRDDHIMPDFHYSDTPGLVKVQKKSFGGGIQMPKVLKAFKGLSGSINMPKIKGIKQPKLVKGVKAPFSKRPIAAIKMVSAKIINPSAQFRKPGKNLGG